LRVTQKEKYKNNSPFSVSRLDLVGGITFASVPTMTGPAYDKTAVGEEPKELSVQDRLEMIKAGVNEPAKPKWEGTKIVK
jgi:hypothetical protein